MRKYIFYVPEENEPIGDVYYPDERDAPMPVEPLEMGRETCHDSAGEQMAFGTCRKVLDFDGTAWICSECGEHIGPRRWNFCPNCGRKVVD